MEFFLSCNKYSCKINWGVVWICTSFIKLNDERLLSLLLILMNPIVVLYHCYKGFNGVILQGVTKYGTGHRIVFFKSFDECPDFLTVFKPCSWFHFPTIHHFMFFLWIQNRKFSRNGAQQSHLLNKRFKKGALLQKFYNFQ